MPGMILLEATFGLSFSILLFRNFVSTVPRELDEAAILGTLGPLLQDYAAGRTEGERFGDWCIRAGHVEATTAGNRFHQDLGEAA